ncbi:MAG: hypothetical protein IKC37_04705 [Clostridia bacterium]|nr:hypothetical protein [Clostridia bacterium]
MAKEKKSLITRLLEGKEKSEEYARSTLPTNRWQLFFDIFKGNFWKLVKVNLLMLLFFLPTIALFVIRVIIAGGNATLYPFQGNLGMSGIFASGRISGMAESLQFQTDAIFFAALLVSMLIASVGLAGGMYVVRNMVWTEGIFVTNDFWRGVKLNYKNALQTTLLYGAVLLLTSVLINVVEMTLAMGGVDQFQTVMFRISQALCYVLIGFGGAIALWMISLGVNYTQNFFQLLKNAFFITIGSLPQTIFFGVIALAPYFLFLFNVTFITGIAVVIIAFFGFAYTLLVWLDFSQWLFDKYLNPKIEGAKVGRGLYSKGGQPLNPEDESEASIEYQRVLLAAGKSQLSARPIKPIDDELTVYELPESFTREDLKKLRESKQTIAEDSAAYVEEHKNDENYVEYNRQFAEREKALQETDSKKKKKKNKRPKLLGE